MRFSYEEVLVIKVILGTSLVVRWLRIHLPMQGTRVRSLVGELRSHMHGATKPLRCRTRVLQLQSPCAATKDPTCRN